MPTALVVAFLMVAVGAVGWASIFVWIRINAGASLWGRMKWLPPALVLLLVGFMLVVELRCTLGWIDEAECWR